ncbi:MAG: penicillin-binding protein 1C [Kiritimatiellae bacterium]|nr:penicillin-binding protein 1C [Kiritimatiellia bacterium]
MVSLSSICRNWRKTLKWTAGIGFAFGIVAVLLSYCLCTPPLKESETYPAGIILTDREGKTIRVGLGAHDTDCRPFYRVRKGDWIVPALVAAEDGGFYSHHGISWKSILRAMWQNFSTGRRISGASTLTTQAVRLIEPHPRNLWWKWVEAFQGFRLERARSKNWILEQYLNRAPFGSNLIGIESASQGWFGKDASSLSLGEAALLAGMVQSPSRFRPDRHLDAALRRRKYVLDRMVALGYIGESQRADAESAPIELSRSVRPFLHPFFADWATQVIGKKTGIFTTTLDREIQRLAEAKAEAGAQKLRASVAIVVVDVKNSAVRALACSGNYFDNKGGQVNTATASRPAGSTLKPFIFASALDLGVVAPTEVVVDVPRRYGNYAPVNFDRTFFGTIPIREALILSLNIPFLDLVKKCGKSEINQQLRDLGLTTIPENPDEHGLGIAVGNVDVRLVDLANAYAVFARGGNYLPVSVLETAALRPPVPSFSEAAAWIVSDYLSGDERSLDAIGHVADVKLPRIAWKTGTSSAYRDAWTIAWTPDYVVGVWCGHKIGKFGDRQIVGAKAAAPVAWEVFRALIPQSGQGWFAKPATIVERRICKDSGLPPSGDCPETNEGIAIRDATSPHPCPVHIHDWDGTVQTRWPKEVVEFWKTNGKIDRVPSVVKDQPVEIKKPADGTTFKWIPNLRGQAIVIQPAHIRDEEKVWWYIDSQLVGTTQGTQPFFYRDATLGRHTIICATQQESDSISITVE